MRHVVPTAVVMALCLSGCLRDPAGCLLGNPYRFAPPSEPLSVALTQTEGQPIDVTIRMTPKIGYACDSPLGLTNPHRVQVQRDGVAISDAEAHQLPDFGAYTLRVIDQTTAGEHRYRLTALDAQARSLGSFEHAVNIQSPLTGFPTLTVNDPKALQPTLSWKPVKGVKEYLVVFSYDDPLPYLPDGPIGRRETQLTLRPEVTSYRIGERVPGSGTLGDYPFPFVMPGQSPRDALIGAWADKQHLTVYVAAAATIPAGAANAPSYSWEHRSATIPLSPTP